MEIGFEVARILSIAAFAFYGTACLVTKRMVSEFERYGLARWRRLIGGLELSGALGLLAGYLLPQLVVAASAGLSLLMLAGVITRVRIRDPLVLTTPALALLLVNVYVLLYALSSDPPP